MEDTAPQTEAVASAERPSSPEPAAKASLASLSDAVRADADVNGGDDRSADAESPDHNPAEAAPASDVKLPRSDVRGTGGRRAAAAAANAQRIAELERQLAERDPEKIRSDLETQRQRAAEDEATRAASDAAAQKAAWYARVRDVPDRNLSDQEYRDREDYKAELDAYTTTFPKARTAFEAQARHEVEAGWANIQAHLRSEMEQLASLPGVDRDAFKRESRLSGTGRHLYDAGGRAARADLQPKLDAALEKVRRLEAEGRQFRLSGANGLGAARAPINGGRSAAHNGRPTLKTASASDLFAAATRQTFGDDA